MFKSSLLAAVAAIVGVVSGNPQTPCAFSWNGFGATSDAIPLSFAPFACQQFFPTPQFPANIPSPQIAAGIVANMAGCALNDYAYIWAYEGLGPSVPGQCYVLNFATGAVEVQEGLFCLVFRPFICYTDNTYSSVANLITSTVTIISETTPTVFTGIFTTETSTSLTDTTDIITTIDFVTVEVTTEYTTTVPSTTITTSTDVISQFATTVLTLTSSIISTVIVGSTTLTQEFVYFVTTTTEIAVPGSTTITTTLATTTVCGRTTVSRCPGGCPTSTISACPCTLGCDDDFVVVSNLVPFNQANCACERIYAGLAAPERSEIRKAAMVMRECVDCDSSQGAWIEPISDSTCSVLTPSGSIKFVPCDSLHRVLCRVPQALAQNNCFECQFNNSYNCAINCPSAPKKNPWKSQCFNPESSSSSSSDCGCAGKKKPPKALGSKPGKGRPIPKAITYTVCPIVISNMFLLTNVNMGGSTDFGEACFQAGGSLLELLVSQQSAAISLLSACGETEGWIAAYNTGSTLPCGFLSSSNYINMFIDQSSCTTPRAILCAVGNNPPQTTGSSIIPVTFTTRTTLATSTFFFTFSTTLDTTSTSTEFVYTAIVDTTAVVSTDLVNGATDVTATTTSVSTDTQVTSVTFRGFSTGFTVDNTSVTISSPISTVTSTNYLATTTTSVTLSVLGCKSGMSC